MSSSTYQFSVASPKMAYYIQHTSDSTFAPWYASTYEYASRLFMSIHESRPELSGKLEIVEVIPDEMKPYKPAPPRPWCCSNTDK